MRFYILPFVLCFALFLQPKMGLATHVVGGEVKYDALGNDRYYIHLTLYVDCINGSPGAISLDSTGFLGVFDGLSGDSIHLDTVYRVPPIRLNKSYYECVKPSGDVCVDMYTYDTVMTLPENEAGYHIVYQRCCRNHSILNLNDPGDQGASYTAFIPGVKRFGLNSNPRFNERPPNYLCVSQPLIFDHSATDPDGDSMVYRICTPFLGATARRPKPLPLAPPHDSVIWQAPYTDQLPLPVKDSFVIDAQTGKLSFIPNRVGQYVFGVCVEEYRKGELMGSSIRDYQFNVIACEIVIEADIFIPDFTCQEEIEISVRSTEATHYHWDFGLDSVDSDTSNLERPTFRYPGPGRYLVTLEVFKGRCTDTVSQFVDILNRGARDTYNHEKCRNDSLLVVGEGFFGAQATLRGNTGFKAINDSSLLIWSRNSGSFIVEYDTAGCIVYDSHYIDMPFIEPVVSRDSSPHCLGSIFSIQVDNSTAFKELTWIYKNADPKVSQEFMGVVAFNQREEVVLVTHEEGSHCIDSFRYAHTAPSNPGFEIKVPNIISPNEDGMNDCFMVEIVNGDYTCGNYHLRIYNRWGELVYEHDEPDRPPCWEGINYKNGEPVAPSAYFYLLNIDGFESHGTITVLR